MLNISKSLGVSHADSRTNLKYRDLFRLNWSWQCFCRSYFQYRIDGLLNSKWEMKKELLAKWSLHKFHAFLRNFVHKIGNRWENDGELYIVLHSTKYWTVQLIMIIVIMNTLIIKTFECQIYQSFHKKSPFEKNFND